MKRSFFYLTIVVLFYISSIGWIWERDIVKKNKEATKLYEEDNIDEALSKWRDAQIKNPENTQLHYNIANALHEKGQYEESYNEYEKSLYSKDAELQAKSYYNIGNTSYRMGKLPEAIESYEKGLEIAPDDEDAKYNIEFIKKKMKEEKEKKESSEDNSQESKEAQSQSGQPQAGEGEEKKEDETKEAMKQGEEEKEEKEGEEEGAGEEEKDASEEKKEMQPQPRKGEEKEGEMSEEDAIRLLDAVKDDEEKLQRRLRKSPGEGRYRVEKDW